MALNRPYDLHPGSVEWRTQVRLFFEYLEQRFAEASPGTEGRAPYRRVWRNESWNEMDVFTPRE